MPGRLLRWMHTHGLYQKRHTHIYLEMRCFALVMNIRFSTANMPLLGDCNSDLTVQP